MNCKHCNKPLEGKKMYCNDACRMAYNRSLQPEHLTEPEQSKNKQPEHLNYQVQETRSWNGEKMFYCSKHQGHVESYCYAMCNLERTCNHILTSN